MSPWIFKCTWQAKAHGAILGEGGAEGAQNKHMDMSHEQGQSRGLEVPVAPLFRRKEHCP